MYKYISCDSKIHYWSYILFIKLLNICQDKGKYEVMAGQQKLADDLAEFWGELLGRYPAVIGIIDPMRKQVNI